MELLLFVCKKVKDLYVFCRILEQKADQIISTLLVNYDKPIPGGAPAQGGAVPAGIKEELSSLKNTQSLVQHQLQDLRYVLSGVLTTSWEVFFPHWPMVTCLLFFQTVFGRESEKRRSWCNNIRSTTANI